ncbi:hypothetical protein [Corynebacterium sp. H127]
MIPTHNTSDALKPTDPNRVNRVAQDADEVGLNRIYTMADIEKTLEIAAGPSGTHGKLSGIIDKGVAAFTAMHTQATESSDEETLQSLEKFRSTIRSYVKAYDFLSQIVPYDLEMEARSIPSCPLTSAVRLDRPTWSFNFGNSHKTSTDRGTPSFEFVALKCSIFPPGGKGFRGGHYVNLSTSNVRKSPDVKYISFERHHIVAQSVMRKVHPDLPTGMNEYKGPAIQMLPEDHRLTLSHGRSPEATAYRARQEKLIQEGKIDEIYEIEYNHLETLFPGKYTAALNEMLDYALSKGYMKVDFRTTLT